MKEIRKFFINIIIILIVLILVLYFSLKDNYQEVMSAIINMDPLWVIMAIIIFIISKIGIGLSSYVLVKVNGEYVSFARCIQISFIKLFFHGVTPFAGGGGPMEIYYLHNEDITLTKSTNIVLQNFIVYQISLVLVGVLAFFL